MELSVLFDVDVYKSCQWPLYEPGYSALEGFIESRGGLYSKTCWFGLQYYLKRYLVNRCITMEEVEEANEMFPAVGLPFNYEGWKYIVQKHGGLIPVKIRSIPEGTVIPTKNVLAKATSTDPNCAWVEQWIESSMLRVWGPTNVATLSWHCREDMFPFALKTCDIPSSKMPYYLHDFGSRGVSSQESAGWLGMGHLVNFRGTDTVPALKFARSYYNCKNSGNSIVATEHSNITSWGRSREILAYGHYLDTYAKPGAMIACVSDSYNLWDAIDNMWGGELRQKVIDSGAMLVIRPDSGDPVAVVLESLRRLDAKFGHKVNNKGYRVLNHVRVIQGDGINHAMIVALCTAITEAGYSMENIAFGMGGGLLQMHNRDTNKYAFKCSSITVNGEERDVYKDPVTDPGKTSKYGRLDVVYHKDWQDKGLVDGYETVKLVPGQEQHPDSVMRTVYENGVVYNDQTLDEIRARALEGSAYGVYLKESKV
jgi:nicotinamide phosphoribosyltransferase